MFKQRLILKKKFVINFLVKLYCLTEVIKPFGAQLEE